MCGIQYKLIFVVLLISLNMTAKIRAHPVVVDKTDVVNNDSDFAEPDSNVENALINYLYAKQLFSRLRQQMNMRSLERKRSYWKQCAFNAVSCFG